MMLEKSVATTPTSIISTICLEDFCNCHQQQSKSKLSALSQDSNIKKAILGQTKSTPCLVSSLQQTAVIIEGWM